MSLSQALETALAARGVFSNAAQTVAAQSGDLKLTIDLTALETLGCCFTRFELETSRLAQATPDDLKTIASQLSARVNYLLEPIAPIEIDPQGCTVQMRSKPPLKNDDGTIYYELLVRRGGSLSLARFQKQPGDQRTLVAAQVTREVLRRLAEDFAAVV